MYDMYPWDSANQGDYPPGPLRSRRAPSPRTPLETHPSHTPLETHPSHAVQVALDRRDNGGDAADSAGEPLAGRAFRSGQ